MAIKKNNLLKNEVKISGKVSQVNLQYSSNYKEGQLPSILGYVSVDTTPADSEGPRNIVPVHVMVNSHYTSKEGKLEYNNSYDVLKTLMELKAEAIDKPITARGSFRYNPYINKQTEELVEQVNIQAGYWNTYDAEPEATFATTVAIGQMPTPIIDKDGNESEGINFKGMTFNYKGGFVPVMFTVENPKGAEHITSDVESSLGEGHPSFVNLRGKIISINEKKEKRVASDWGEDTVEVSYVRVNKNLAVSGVGIDSETYENLGLDEVIKKGKEEKELEDAKARERFENNKAKAPDASASTAKKDEFVF